MDTLRDLLAVDIGGANLKAADGSGWAHAEPLAMWREWRQLRERLAALVLAARPRRMVVTMTGEIADCFADRAAGVRHIVDAVVQASDGLPEPPEFYSLTGRFIPAWDAAAAPLTVAAANWHALARLAATLAAGLSEALLLDVGSTTVDVVPIRGGRPHPLAWTDWDRMATGELVYTGIERTPVASLVRGIVHRDLYRPVSSETFATTRDVWLLLGCLDEDAAATDTADGGPATREAARIRLARMMLLEPTRCTLPEAVAAARQVANRQARLLGRSMRRVSAAAGIRPAGVILSGHGDGLADAALRRFPEQPRVIRLAELLGAPIARVASAHAVALASLGRLP